MPYYVKDIPATTIENDIREVDGVVNLNPFILMNSQVLKNNDKRFEFEIELSSDSKLSENGKNENYKRQYYQDVFSAPTTAGYTQMKQKVFFTKFGVSYGFQYGTPTIR